MIIQVKKSFEKDIARVTDKVLARKVLAVIEELENHSAIVEVPHLKKMSAKGNYYRIRIGGYRLGIKVENDTVTLIRFMDRKDIYKYFP